MSCGCKRCCCQIYDPCCPPPAQPPKSDTGHRRLLSPPELPESYEFGEQEDYENEIDSSFKSSSSFPPVPVEPYTSFSQHTPGYVGPEDPYKFYHGAWHLKRATEISNAVSTVDSQDPDGIKWISPSTWIDSQWDGNPINPCTSSLSQVIAHVFPTVNTMRGLRERFYEVNPFADVVNPTPAEIDSWNIEIIRHFRRLLGISTPVSVDKNLSVRSQWSAEAAHGFRPGQCVGSTDPHCGASFLPDCGLNSPNINGSQFTGQSDPSYQPFIEGYYPGSPAQCIVSVPGGGAEGIATINTSLPWSIKLTRVIAQFLASDGLGAHTGPFLGREKFGPSFFLFPGNEAATVFRGKWSGSLTGPCP